MNNFSMINALNEIAYKAGEIIMKYFKQDIGYSLKNDNSFVTKADIEASHFIVESLLKLNLGFPIISEEEDYSQIKLKNGESFWLVDPLDGTSNFVNHSNNFTVNIALIKENKPHIGVVYVPTQKQLFYNKDFKAYTKQIDEAEKQIFCSNKKSEITALISSRKDNGIDFIKELYDIKETKVMGSSLKLVKIAEGYAEIHPRGGRTMEWDTAASHAILNAAGGEIVDLSNNELTYGKPNFENPSFIARSKSL
jgi:3'(2'), 5'-bisphosphate nucleotidase